MVNAIFPVDRGRGVEWNFGLLYWLVSFGRSRSTTAVAIWFADFHFFSLATLLMYTVAADKYILTYDFNRLIQEKPTISFSSFSIELLWLAILPVLFLLSPPHKPVNQQQAEVVPRPRGPRLESGHETKLTLMGINWISLVYTVLAMTHEARHGREWSREKCIKSEFISCCMVESVNWLESKIKACWLSPSVGLV